MTILQAVLLGERITGEGFVQQLDLATNIPLWEQEPIVGLLVVGLLIGGLYPNKQVRRHSMALHQWAKLLGARRVAWSDGSNCWRASFIHD